MHLINEAIIFRIDNRFAGQKFREQCRAARSVDSREPRDDSAAREHQLLRFEQDSSGLARRLGRAFFRDPSPVALPVHTRAARKYDCRSNESIEEIASAIQVNPAIKIDIAAARARTMNYGIKIFRTRTDLSRICDIDCNDRVRFGSKVRRRFCGMGPAMHDPASVMKQIRRRLPNITATGN